MSNEVRSPFDLTANLHAYVPREATEGCLRAMVRALRAGACRIVLTGPTGHGKTLVLQMIADRVGDELGVVYLPYGALPPSDLCTWALGRMEVPKGDDPIETLVTLAGDLKENGKALLLLIDDGNTLSLDTVRWLSTTSQELDGGLRIVVAATDGPLVEPLIEAFGPEVEPFRLDVPMTLDETQQYIKSRLAISTAPDSTRSLFDDATIRALHRSSEGVARQIHQLASAAIRGLPFDRLDRVPAGETADLETDGPAKGKPKTRRKPRRKKGKAAASSGDAPAERAANAAADTKRKKRRAEHTKAIETATTDDATPASDATLPPRDPDSIPMASPERRESATEPLLLDDVIFSPQRDTLKRPPIVSMAAPTRWRVFRSSLIVAMALIGTVLARPSAELGEVSPEVARAADLDPSSRLPEPKLLDAPRHQGMDVTSVPHPVAHPSLGNIRQTFLASDPKADSSPSQATAGRGRQITPARSGRRPKAGWPPRMSGEDPGNPPAAPAP